MLRAHPVFKSLTVVDGGDTWDYEYVASPKRIKDGHGKLEKKTDDGFKKEATETKGQLHHILSTKIIRTLNIHPTLKGVFEREDPIFKYRAKDTEAHKGYQQWHRDIDNKTVEWLQNHPQATPQQFKDFLNKIYQQPDINSRIPGVNIL